MDPARTQTTTTQTTTTQPTTPSPTQTNLSQQNQETDTIDQDLLTAIMLSPESSDINSIFRVINSGENTQMTTPPLQTPSPQL
jgi:hypothetical protein